MMTVEFGKALYAIKQPLKTWSVQPDEEAKCSACEDTLTFIFPVDWEKLYPRASATRTPTAIRCNCFIQERVKGFAQHHKLNRKPVPITLIS